MNIPFVGPSYDLRSRPADVQRTINLIPVPLEPGNEKTAWVFKDVPGLRAFSTLGAPIRGILKTSGRLFAAAAGKLYEINSAGTATELGALFTTSGMVGMESNGTQLFVSDGAELYTYTFAGGAFASATFPGKARIAYLNQRILFVYRDSQRFGWTDLISSTVDAISFASAESSPDKLVSIMVDHLEAFLFGEVTGEPWQNTTSSSVFERNTGGVWEIGAASEFSLAKIDNSTFWLSASENGQGAVYRLNVYQPQRISTQAIEEKLAGLDLSQAVAYSYESEKSSFYCLNVPGLDTTLVFDVFSGQWHERAEWVNGALTKHRATCHAFAFGKHLFGADDGIIYEADPTLSDNAGDILIRDRIAPAQSVPGRARVHPERFKLDCERGNGGQVMMRYSPDGGANWSEWRAKSLGEAGNFGNLVQWKRLTAGRDFVVQIRCTDAVPFNPVAGELQ